MNKEGSFKPVIVVMIITLLIATFWETFPSIKNTVHWILDPSAGALLNWDIMWGMTLLILIISIIMTLAQKYATDQQALKEIKEEQKKLQEEMKEFKDDPTKVMELQKKQFEFFPLMMKHSMRPIIFTGIPIVLFFRWFMDYFGALAEPVKFLGFFNWFWYYLIASIIFSSILRKVFKVH